jgi:2-polyprenyl-3-methyl-5-hydroxy-6-metoxy-1,4-benzoquinol methylase
MKSKWDERYQTENYFYGKDPNDFLKETIKMIPPGSRILCLAEGEGRNAVYLASLGFRVTALDQSSVGLSKLTQLASEKNVHVETILADLSEYKIEANTWDAIVSIWCHLPSTLRKIVYSDCVKGLKHGGLFILEAYTPKQLEFKTGGPDNIDLLLTKEIIKEELLGLECFTLIEKNREIYEGQGHRGMSAVVQVLAKKELV